MPSMTSRRETELRKAQMTTERSSWMHHWREISEYQQPRVGRFLVSDVNRGEKRHNSIIDRTPIGASRTLAAGMQAGVTSPARPWFRVTLSDKDLVEFGPVKTWLHRTGLLMREVFAKSNTYNTLHTGYLELGLFGTWATAVMDDFDNVIHHYAMTVGEYALSTDEKGRVCSMVRELKMTVYQVVNMFGIEKVSDSTRTAYQNNQMQSWVDVTHMVEPNPERDPSKADSKNMKWRSVYWETKSNQEQGFLREAGFTRMRVLAPRWDVTSNDVYGHSPGMEALGDVKQLQQEQLRKGQGIDYKTNPPLQVPTQLRNSPRSRLPGGVYFYDQMNPAGGVRSAFEVNLDLSHLLEDIRDVRERINAAYYADLFLMIANDTRPQRATATEIAERHEEKMLMLGPVLERLHNELLSPLIDITFDACANAGILPPIPKELEGMELQVEFISVLAQAQRMVSAAGTDRLLGTIGTIAPLRPEVLDKVDFDQVVDDYADMFGVNPEIIVPDDVVAQRRAQREQQMAAQQAAAAAPVMADAAKKASEVDPTNLRDVMGMVSGYNSPTATEIA